MLLTFKKNVDRDYLIHTSRRCCKLIRIRKLIWLNACPEIYFLTITVFGGLAAKLWRTLSVQLLQFVVVVALAHGEPGEETD